MPNKTLALFILFASQVLAAEPAIDWPTLSDTKLLTHACSYATSDAKKAVAGQAGQELRRRGPEGLRALMDHMHIKNIYIRVTADNWVRGSKDERFPPVLLGYLDSEHERTRSQAAFLLGYYELPAHADKLFPLLEHEKTEKDALRTLGKWKVAQAIPHITPYLKHEEERCRIIACNALRDIGDPSASEHLLPLLNDPYFTVRYVAARALSHTTSEDELKSFADASSPGLAKRHLEKLLKPK